MTKLRSVTAFMMAILILLLSACSGNTENSGTPDSAPDNPNSSSVHILQLLYCSNDTLNPYNTKNKNNAELGKLLFDPLVTLSNEFEPIMIIAESVSLDGKICTVKLRNVLFSDGSSVTADDVVNSYNLAKASTLYSHLFYEVIKVYASDMSTVVFELKNNDPYFANLLTFPILKKGTESLKNEDNVEIVPTGSGRFVFSREEESLTSNPHYLGSCSIEKINLIDAPDSESVEHYVEIGATDIYFTDPINNSIIRMSGQKNVLNTTNLVYIGINHNYAPLADPIMRQIISSAINRSQITEIAFYKNAEAATGFFHPDWKAVSGYQTLQKTAQNKICIENLEKIGYNILDSEGFRVHSKGSALSFTLLVNKENAVRMAAASLIKEQLAAVGIRLTVNAVSKEQYFEALKTGAFQLYLSEVRLTPNMDISPLVLSDGSAAFGIKAPETQDNKPSDTEDGSDTPIADDYADVLSGYKNGVNTIYDVATSLINHMPIVPVAYRSSLLFHSDNIENIGSPSASDIFLSINNFKPKT